MNWIEEELEIHREEVKRLLKKENSFGCLGGCLLGRFEQEKQKIIKNDKFLDAVLKRARRKGIV